MCSKETEKAAIIRSLIFMQNQSCSKRMMDLLFVEKLAAKPRKNAERLYKEGMRSVQTETREDEMTQKVEPEEPIEESIVDVPPLEYKRESKLKEIKIWDATEELREYCAKRGIDYIHHSWPVDYGD